MSEFTNAYADSKNIEYKGPWIKESSKGDEYYYCIPCEADYKISSLWGAKRHEISDGHEDNYKKWALSCLNMGESTVITIILQSEKDSRYVEFVIENNISFDVGEKIFGLVKQFNKKELALNKCYLDSRRISDIIRECFFPFVKLKIETKLLLNPFSMLIDEVQ